MPEPDLQAAQGEQSVQSAPTPQTADTPETTTQTVGSESDFKTVADLLDIPPELQDQLAPKAEEKAEPVEAQKPEETKVEDVKQEETDEEEEAEGEEPEEDKQEEAKPPRIDKRLKRINRLTRQKSELEEKVDSLSTRLTEANDKLQRFEKQAPVGTVPKVGPWMPDRETADQYGDLSQKKVLAKAKLEWCDKHRDGVTIVENGQEKFVEPNEVASWKLDAQESLMEINPQITIIEREAKQTFKQQKQGYDQLAVQFWPELADKSSEESQLAASILQEYPATAASPSANYAVGLLIEGMKSIRAKAQKVNGKSPPAPAPKHRDIDERVFTTPRVPLAPHAPGPPTRESSSSSQKQLDEATKSFMDDPDGGVESLAKVFQARESVGKRPAARTPVNR